MKKRISSFLKGLTAIFGLFYLLFPVLVFAEPFLIEGEVVVPETCQVTDTAGVMHNFPKEGSPSGFLGICALVAAKTAGLINEFSFIDFGFGLFLDSINGVKTSSDWDLYWAIYHNGVLAPVGLADLVVKQGDKLSFIYTSFSSGQEFDKLILNLVSLNSDSSGSASTAFPHNPDIAKAVQFLISQQNPQGLIENPIFTDWSALALSAYATTYEPGKAVLTSIKDYLSTNPDPGPSLGSPVLSYIRRAMALMALGINPYSGTKINYIQKIVDVFDGSQIGDTNLVNDDIFALLVLRKTGFDSSDDIVLATTKFILENQKPDGSWTGGVDMTAAAIQALSLVSDIESVPLALQNAKAYLKSQQKPDGGFGNPDSTSWAMQAIIALKENWQDWEKDGKRPGDYLLFLQKQDGSVDSPTPVWSTAFAVPAALGKTWDMILNNFPRQEAKAQEVNTSIFFKELERISQELAVIEQQALMLETKISLLALEKAKTVAVKEKEEIFSAKTDELAVQEKPVLPGFGETNYPKGLSAQVGAVASGFLPYLVGGVIALLLNYSLLWLLKLWKSPQNK